MSVEAEEEVRRKRGKGGMCAAFDVRKVPPKNSDKHSKSVYPPVVTSTTTATATTLGLNLSRDQNRA